MAGLTATFEKQEDERGKQGGRKAGREEGREEGREGKGNYINKLPINRKAAIYLYSTGLWLGNLVEGLPCAVHNREIAFEGPTGF